MKTNSLANPYLILVIGLMAVSTAAIFIRLAQGEDLPSLVIAAGRLAIASVVLTVPVALRYRDELKKLSMRDMGLCMVGGVFLAGHFAAWISSLEYTSVVASVVLVTTSPLFVALLSYPLLGESVTRQEIFGIFLAFAGGVIVAFSGDAGDPPTRPDPLLGNALAVLGAIGVAIYFIVGRRVRPKLSIIPYIWLVYSTAAVVLLFVLVMRGESLSGYSIEGYGWLLALGLIPQLIGHSSFNYALGFFPAAYVSVVVLVEPIGSGLMAFFLLGETPTLLAMVGAAVILVGVGVASFKQSERPTTAQDIEVLETAEL